MKSELSETMQAGTDRELLHPFKASVYPVRMFLGLLEIESALA